MNPIHTEAAYEAALARLEDLWGAAPGSPEALELDALAAAIEAFERRERQAALPPARPGELIAFKLRELGWSQRELARRMGWASSGRVSEIVNGKRGLTLDMVRDLAAALQIDARLLIHEEADGDDAVWVRVRGPIARCAAAQGFLGFASLEALAGSLLASRLAEETGLTTLPQPRTTKDTPRSIEGSGLSGALKLVARDAA